MKKQPFFAKFLENQISEQKLKQIKGGDCPLTEAQTQKAPSDQEDDWRITSRLTDYVEATTMKYPSDQEEH